MHANGKEAKKVRLGVGGRDRLSLSLSVLRVILFSEGVLDINIFFAFGERERGESGRAPLLKQLALLSPSVSLRPLLPPLYSAGLPGPPSLLPSPRASFELSHE